MDYTFENQLDFTLFDKEEGLTDVVAHFHAYSQIIIPRGSGIIVNLGNCAPYELPPQSLLLLSPFIRHRLISTHPSSSWDTLSINLNRLGSEFASTPYLQPIHRMLKKSEAGLLFTGDAIDKITAIFDDIQNLFRMEYMLSILNILHILSQANQFTILANNECHPEHPRDIHFCMAVANYTRENLCQTIDINSVSNLVHMSKSSFSRHFKRFFGQPFHAYILKKKIELACYFLFSTSMTVQEITEYLNFNSASHFIMTFRRFRGITPAKYRLKQHYIT